MKKDALENKTTLQDLDPEMVHCCLDTLMCRLDANKVKDINKALSFIHHAEQLMIQSAAYRAAGFIKDFIESLFTVNHPNNPLQIMDELVGALQPHFSPKHLNALQWSIVGKCVQILERSAETNYIDQSEEKMIHFFGRIKEMPNLARFSPITARFAEIFDDQQEFFPSFLH